MDIGKSSSNNSRSMEEESCIKNTMQMHEQIFKQQVRELHRLYNVQKLLMGQVKKQQIEGTTTLWSSSLLTAPSTTLQIRTHGPVKSSGSLDLKRPWKEEMIIDGVNPNDSRFMIDKQVVELTLGIGRKMDDKRCINTKLLNSSLLTESNQGGSVGGAETETSKSNTEEKHTFLFL